MEDQKKTTTKEEKPSYQGSFFWRLATAPRRAREAERELDKTVAKGEALIALGQAMRASQQ